MESKGGWNARHDRIVSSQLFLFVLINFFTADVVSRVAADLNFGSSGCVDAETQTDHILFNGYLTLAPGTQVYEFPPARF